ncbi:hypothetical protein ACFE04_023381 [Oxalis oulophora]
MSLCFKSILYCSLAVSFFNLVMVCFSGYFYWFIDGWTWTSLVTLFDFVLKSFAWGALYVYLSNSNYSKFPVFLRLWWGFYLSLSCYCAAVDFFLYRKSLSLQFQYFLSDFVSLVSGLVFCCVGFWAKNQGGHDDVVLEEPLLNGHSRVVNGEAASKGADGETPFASAGLFSILTFSWMSNLIAVGNKKTLDIEDVPQLDSRDSSAGLYPVFKTKLQSFGRGDNRVTTPMLVKALIFSCWKDILYTAFLVLTHTLASYVGPYLIDALVQYLNGRRLFKNEGFLLVSAFIVAKIVASLTQRHWFFRLQKVGIRLRSVLIVMIYNKGLTLSCHSKQSHTSGEMINYMSVDAERVGSFSWYMHDPWMVLVQVALALVILYINLGLASVAALFATIIVMFANYPLGKLQENFQEKMMKCKDQRMKATSEILRNMRILKLQGWEMKFLSKVIDLRNVETGWLKKYVYTSAMTSFVFWGAPTFVSVATFGACMLLGIPLGSGKILSALATFGNLQETINNLPDVISMTVQTKVSLDRISSFLCLDDLQSDVIEKLPSSSDTALEIIDGNFSWDSLSNNITLKDINLKVVPGMRVAVCGTVGSGKSTLLSCILGEVPKISGILRLCGTKAYVAQSPWIQSGKIEENILFGKQMDRERYESVLEACSLKKDLEILSFGDQTVIGERGINLSGGQKQRIQIARALYQDADIYLFDDPFSAVDAHTGSHLFKEVLLGLLRSKTVIYVTHQVEFLPAADLILVMKDGKITQAGKYNDILNSGTDFMELVDAHKEALSALDSVERGEPGSQKEENKDVQKDKIADSSEQPKGQLVQEEEREKGKVGFSVYWKYITTAYGGALVPFILLAQLFFQILQIGSNYWMAWATPVSEDVKPPVGGSTLITVYVAFAVGSSLFILIRAVLLATAGYKTATLLFNKMHLAIFRAPMSFFDSTPSGRILNRASTDQSAIDMNLPNNLEAFSFAMIELFGIIGVMSQVAWQVILIFIPVIGVCIWYQQYYLPSARELSRLIGVYKAPVIQHFSETISGSTTIRSFDQESRFRDTNMRLMDGYSRPKFHVAGAIEWLSIAGLVVTYALNLNGVQVWVIWSLCHLENKIISVERILQYIGIPSEPSLVIEENRPGSSWPFHGEIIIQNLQVRYAPHMPLVLRGLTCTIPGGLKTGIVGRTGSGKSTLIQTLFRIVNLSAGQILIDGIDILSIGLHDLRSRLSIIPQDPTMFEGTVRSNLDPLEEYTDDQIWERQLVCLGRVLLKRSKVLVLDEATASVDTTTDNLIQQTLRQHFSDCTVVTIAHRITSVLDSDIVLLLSHGLIEEYDSPAKLLENQSSSFSKLVDEYSARSGSSFD